MTDQDNKRTVKILVASGSLAKINAVKLGAKELVLPANVDVVVEPILGLDSGVRAQPMSDAETIAGARNRLCAITGHMMRDRDAEFAVSIEGGLETNPHDSRQKFLQCFAWVCLKHRDGADGGDAFVSETRTATFALPDIIGKAILEDGEELGVAQDKYFSRFGSENAGLGKGEAGTIGPLTFGAVSRSQYYAPAVAFAFLPFLHQRRHFAEGVPPNSLAR